MVIYAEYLFLENGLAGLVVLLLTRQICGFPANWLRMALGSIFCGLYAFTLFWTGLPVPLSIGMKLIFSMGVVAFVFPCKTWKRHGQGLLIFYIVSFAMGGITIGTAFFLGLMGVSGAGGFYIGQISYGMVILGMAATWSCFSVFASFLKERLWKGRMDMDVEIVIGSSSSIIRGMVDSGNFLKDPLTGKPVFLVTDSLMERLAPEWRVLSEKLPKKAPENPLLFQPENSPPASRGEEQFVNRYRLIPFRSVGEEGGLLAGIRPDRVILHDKSSGPRKVEIILGVYKGSFPASWDGKPYELLLHPAAMEGGVLDGK